MSFEKFRATPGLKAAEEKARSVYFKQLDSGFSRFKFLDAKKLRTVNTNELYISDPANFNDPYDLKLDVKEGINVPLHVLQGAFAYVLKE